ncbi:MAG: hypothetical protein QM619_03665 [Micropruina sp.]|uniref:hypothetical protein n=1 Tax=Micropruina sp. TaxID=2737536 RepID=UPI0039E40FE0
MDPQILSDVVDWTFPVPGPSMRRYLRVQRSVNSIQAVDCGGTAFDDLDYTGERIDQVLFPDVELIRQKGLAEAGTPPNGDKVGDDLPCRTTSLPRWQQVFELETGWEDTVRSVYQSNPVQPRVRQAGRCLSRQTGWVLDGAGDALQRFFVQLDNRAVRAANTSEEAADRIVGKYSAVYADCVGDYAEALRAELLARRPAQIERNRELLTAMAGDLAAAGYVP